MSFTSTTAEPTAEQIENPSRELFSFSPNPEHTGETVVFLHGLISSHFEFADVYPHLQDDYHILLVDLPGHSRSKHVLGPYTCKSAAEHVERIIKKDAHQGRAHIVGLSMGGFVGLQLTALAPERVLTLFVTGASPFDGWIRFLAKQTWLIYVVSCISAKLIPVWLYDKTCDWVGMKRHPELREEMAGNGQSYSSLREIYSSLLEFNMATIAGIAKTGRRIATIAGGKFDNVKATQAMGAVLRSGGSPQSQAFVVRKALHAWDLQYPQLFAAGIRAWIEGKEMPAEYEPLPNV
jgi:pimeloyl-ACP methyl ester carboxylesterase